MKKSSFLFIICCFFIALQIKAQSSAPNLEFVENKGQWDSNVVFKAEIGQGSFFLQKNGFTILLNDPNDMAMQERMHHGSAISQALRSIEKKTATINNAENQFNNKTPIHSHAYKVSFLNANESPEILPDKPLEFYNNYFIGNDPSKWTSNCRVFQGVTYKNIYKNIDLRYYTSNGVLKYDIIVHPGGNPDNIIMKYDGADKLDIKNRELQVKTSVGTVKELAPVTFQLSNDGKKEVDCRFFKSSDNTIRFKIKNYSPSAVLVIDPTLVFASFTGSKTDNWGFTATYGPDGSLYAGGIIHGNGFPVSVGAFQTLYNGSGYDWDVGIIKFNPLGSTRVYATYLGGNSNEYPHSMIVDPQGNLVVFGRTESLNFPTTKPLVGAGGGRDIFVTKFNATGTNIIGSLKIGGSGDDGLNIKDQEESGSGFGAESLIFNYGDWSRGEVILDASNNIYVASCSQSKNFPIIGNVFQPNIAGGQNNQDGVVMKIDPTCNSVIFSSFLGGSDDDVAFVMDISPSTGDLYVGGATLSQDFPKINSNSYQNNFQGNTVGFVSIISNDGSTLKQSTFLGTAGYNTIYGVKFDKYGYPYVMGTTTGAWPIVNAAWGNPGAKQFIAKLQPNLSGIVYTTTFGSPNSPSPNISPVAFLVDRCQNVYISGWGSFYAYEKPDPYRLMGTYGMPYTPDALKKYTDGRDFYFIVIKRDASNILYGTFFGQQDPPNNNSSLSEHVDGGTSRYDQNGVIYQAICANCYTIPSISWPTTPGAWAKCNGTSNNCTIKGQCNLAAVKIAFNFAGVSAYLKSLINGQYDTMGCIPLTVTFKDTIRNAKSYLWNFGEGAPDSATTSSTVVHTYNNVGNYTVRLIAIDSTSCNISDTVYIHIIARSDKSYIGFTSIKQSPPCYALSYLFTNTSIPPSNKPFTDSSFRWNFGDGSPLLITGTNNVTHSYANAGTYFVSLTLIDTNYCNSQDSVVQRLSVSPIVKAQFITPSVGCVPYTAYFDNTSLGGQQFYWKFGDGNSSQLVNPTNTYTEVGTYTVSLVVIDSNTCNIIDSTKQTIYVSPNPQAGFTTTPVPPTPNTLTVFHNSSTGGVLYKWYFGDGDSTIKTTMDTVGHQYNATGTYNACLVTINQNQCADTVCQQVQTIVNPLLDVPNAFTPGRFGQNGVVMVRGFGISNMMFRIYNRWGQMVFESTNPAIGWDGTYKGILQPADVYVYTLQADFTDGTKTQRKGDITLIR